LLLLTSIGYSGALFHDWFNATMSDIKQEILVVDDEPSGGEAVADFLHIEGYQRFVCTHPQEVLASLLISILLILMG